MIDPIVLSAGNAGLMTGAGNNTYLLEGGERTVLIDAGVGASAHLQAVRDQLVRSGRRLTDVLVTHAHADHASGATQLAAAFGPRFSKHAWPDEDSRYQVAWQHLADEAAVDLGDCTLTALCTPGHSPDHLVFWHQPSGVAFTGDLVAPGGSVLIAWSRGGNMAAYLSSVERLLALGPRRLWPAHGPVIDQPAAVLRATLAHRLRREAQVYEAVARGVATVPAIVESIYDGLDPRLVWAARENVRAHLEKLKTEGRVIDEGLRGSEASERWRPGPG